MLEAEGRVRKMVKVLFIAGPGRSGSTLLAELLGQMRSFESIGELSALWNRGLLENQPCGCRVAFRECGYWERMVEPYLGATTAELERITRLRNGLFTLPFVRRVVRRDLSGVRRDAREYAQILGTIYTRISDETNCEVIVDSSKQPTLGYVIDLIPNVELYVLHLVRDPRAVAFSWRRKRMSAPSATGSQYMPMFSIKRTAVVWLITNAICEYLRRLGKWRYMRLRYEDFVLDPRKTLEGIRHFVGADDRIDFFVDGNMVRLNRNTHQVWGNPIRFNSREIRIKPDTEWRSVMPGKDRAFVAAMTWPMLLRYGYVAKAKRELVSDGFGAR